MQYETDQYQSPYFSYLEITPGSKDKILSILNAERHFDEPDESETAKWLTELTALPDIHLKFPAKGKGSMSTTISLLAIGILLLIIAYINFINFSVSMSPVRLKYLNIRRIFGETSFFLRFSIVMEAVLISFIAVLISIVFIHYLGTSVVVEFIQANISLSKNWGLFLLTGGIFLGIGLLAGIYPAFYSTSFKPAMAVGGSFSVSFGSRILKNALIVIQFASAIILIIVSGFIKIQHDYMQDKSWNMKEKVVFLNVALA
jgi:putative ABC transport system permease protein